MQKLNSPQIYNDNNNMNQPINPFLRWAGSKRKLIPELSLYWQGDGRRYVEPFMGSGCLFFALNPMEALLADINIELIQTFKAVKISPEEVHEALADIPKGSDSYYEIRARDVTNETAAFKAARFIFLNRYCFNGLYRTNLAGKFNVPFGNRTGSLCSLVQLKDVAKALKNVEIHSGDFESIINNQVKRNDFVYLDPPYAVKNQRIFNQYGPDSFGLKDLERLKASLDFIDAKGAKFLLSYADCNEAREVFNKWDFKEVSVQRNIAGFVKHRRKASELLFSNIQPSGQENG